MTYKDRIYKRQEPTPDRRREQEALIASNLLGLALTPAVTNKQVIEKIKQYRVDRGEDDPIYAPKVPNYDSIRKARKQSPIPSASLFYSDTQRNFAVFHPGGGIGNRVFIHGREMFTEEAASRYFNPGRKKAAFDYADFSGAAKEKLRNTLSHESFASRMFDYGNAKDSVEYVRQVIATLKDDFPEVALPELPALTAKNAMDVVVQALRCYERHGIDVANYSKQLLFPDEERIAAQKQKLRLFSQREFDTLEAELRHEGHGAMLDQHMQPLRLAIAAQEFDPELMRNFAAGVRKGMPEAAALEDICAQGREVRCEQILRHMASQIHNPYAEPFLAAERIVADAITHSVPPRIVRNAIRNRSAVVVTDRDSISTLNDLLVIDGGSMLGKYESKIPGDGKHSNDFIMIASPGLEYQRLGRIARHEFAHHQDVSRPAFFAARYSKKIDRPLEHDRETIDDTLRFLSYASPQRDAGRITELAHKRGLLRPSQSPSPASLKKMHEQLLHDVSDIRRRLSKSFMPYEGGKSLDGYNLDTPSIARCLRSSTNCAANTEKT